MEVYLNSAFFMNTSNIVNWTIYRDQIFGSPNRWDEGNNFSSNPPG